MNDVLKRLTQFPTQFFLLLIGALLFIPFIGGSPLFDWDEINFAESAREMLVTHNFSTVQINFQPFYEKPPFFIWLQALSMSRYGVNSFAARLPNAIFGLLTMIAVFNLGRKYFNSRFGVLWALLFACSLLPQLYFKSGIIDPVFNYFIFVGYIFLFHISIKDDFASARTNRSNKRWYLLASGLATGIALLTKGPVALGIIVLSISVMLIVNRGKLNFNFGDLLIWLVIVGGVAGAWVYTTWSSEGSQFLDSFFAYQWRLFHTEDAGHGGPWWFYLPVLFFGCFPAAALAIGAIGKNANDSFYQRSLKQWMSTLFLVVFILFSVVQTKIIHYTSLCYFPITFLGAYYLHHLLNDKLSFRWWHAMLLLLSGAPLLIAIACLPLAGRHPQLVLPYLHDSFSQAALEAKVYWNSLEAVYGVIALILLLIVFVLAFTAHRRAAVYLLLISSAVVFNVTISQFVPRLGLYSQGALIEFIEQHKTEPCYIETIGFKSYAPYFYHNRQPSYKTEINRHLKGEDTHDAELAYLVFEKTDKPVYLVTKEDFYKHFEQAPLFDLLYRKNGYLFLRKKKLD
ncbi:MAG: glycosyltransferase family 39 protein [Chitinophagales bacterium]